MVRTVSRSGISSAWGIALVVVLGGCGSSSYLIADWSVAPARSAKSAVVTTSQVPLEPSGLQPADNPVGPVGDPGGGAAPVPDASLAERPNMLGSEVPLPSESPPLPFLSRELAADVDPLVLSETLQRIEETIVVAGIDPRPATSEEEVLHQQHASSELRDIFFRFDSWMITEESEQVLSGDADWLRAHAVAVAIEGHCDERGTQAYNLVLGERRARAIKSYLVNLGIEAAQLQVVSYGKERPLCLDHDERCWRQNRRGHLAMGR